MDPQARRNMRFEQVERFLASGMQITKWCKLNDMSSSTLYMWLKRYRENEDQRAAEIDEIQKNKQTTEWIELTREDLAQSVALAPVIPDVTPVAAPSIKEPPLQESVVSHDRPACISLFMNGVHMGIPPGTHASDITCVLQAVAHL